MDWTQTVNDIYQQELGRQADPSGMASFTNLLNQGMTGEQMRAALRSSPEGIARYGAPAPAPAPENQFVSTNNESGEGYWTQGPPAPVDPYTGQVGTYVNYGGDIDQFVPLTLATPRGTYTSTNYESGEGYFNPFTPEQASAAAAAIESNRQSELQRASQILAETPLGVSDNMIQTQYGDVDVSTFFPIAAAGQPITGDTPAQLFDPQSKMPVFLSNPNDPFSYTYDNTGIPAISGTVAQQAALYKPIEQKGVFGSLGGDLLSVIKDPYFHKFLAASTAIASGPATGFISGATGLGPVASGAIYGGTTGAAQGLLTGGGLQGALKGGAVGAAGGALGGYLKGGDIAQSLPVNAPSADFTGMSYGDLGSLGIGEFQPFVGGDMGLGSGMITQFNPDGSFGNIGAVAADTIPEFGDVPTYDFNAPPGQITPDFDPNARVLTAQEAENLMRYNILPADMQTPAAYDWLETPKALLSGEYGGLIKSGLTLGGLAAANALKPQQQTQTTNGGLTSEQLQAMVAAMPSMIGQYTSQAGQGGTGLPTGGYNPSMDTSMANLFPGFTLPTQGPFYGAGRFGENYNPAPMTTLV